MAKIPLAPGPVPFILRPGVPPFADAGWRGMNTESDPGSLSPNELQYGENIRLTGKGIRNRSGYSKVLDLGEAAGSIYHFGALPSANPRTRLWFTALAVFDPGADLQTGSSVYHIDPSESPVFQTHSRFYSAAGSIALLAKFGTRLYIGERDTLKELVDVSAPIGLNLVDIAPTAPALSVVRFPGYTIRAVREYDSKLFIALEHDTTPATLSKIMVYDGLDVVDDLTGIGPCYAFGTWRDRLIAGFDATTGHIQTRVPGTSPGTWTVVAAVDFGTTQAGNAMAEYGPYTYIATGRDTIYRYDGTTLTLIHTIADSHATFLSGCNALTLHNNLLYYGWNDDSEDSWIGRHDLDSTATEWVDGYKDISSDQPNFKRLTAMKSYRGQIYCGGLQMWVIATAPNDVKGTVEVINDTGVITDDFRVIGFLRYP